MMEFPQICIPKSGDILLISIHRNRYLIIIGRLTISSVSGIWFRRPRAEPKMTAMKRFEEFVETDNLVFCQKCIKYPIDFYYSIREGKELQYSGYERTIIDKILRRNHGM